MHFLVLAGNKMMVFFCFSISVLFVLGVFPYYGMWIMSAGDHLI